MTIVAIEGIPAKVGERSSEQQRMIDGQVQLGALVFRELINIKNCVSLAQQLESNLRAACAAAGIVDRYYSI